MPPPEILPFGPEAAAVLSALQEAAGEPGWSPASLASLLALPGHGALTLRPAAGGGPAGFALYRVVPPEAELLSIGVLPGARRQGFGRALLDAVLRKAADAGARRLFLEVAVDNDAARALYERRGFERRGLRPAYYSAPGAPARDALILALDLPAS